MSNQKLNLYYLQASFSFLNNLNEILISINKTYNPKIFNPETNQFVNLSPKNVLNNYYLLSHKETINK